ncbi:MAG: S8 family serine peptidase [Anaerolineaceae bacterium]|nr:S8 family serine peptidase [Anaerolineaceae bacterium]
MFKKNVFGILLLAFAVIVVNVQGGLTAQGTEPAPAGPPISQMIVQFAEEATGNKMAEAVLDGRIQQLSAATETDLQYMRAMSGDAHVLKLAAALPVAEAEVLAAELSRQPGVAYAEPDYIRQAIGDTPIHVAAPLLTPNDPQYGNQWHYNYVPGTSEGLNLPSAWNITTGLSTVVVAVIDTGILPHTDLAGRTVAGYDFIADISTANDGNGRDNNPADPGDWVSVGECGATQFDASSWHGTHVAGTIGAASNNGVGVAGVNWNAKILPVRVLGKCGGYTSDIVDGMRWAAGLSVTGVPANANPADVINMSLGGLGACSISEQDAVNAIVAAGTAVVVAAGNSSDDASGYSPASCSGVITVASNNRQGNRAWYSNYGSTVEVTAPGGDTTILSNGVLSTLDGGTMGPLNDNSFAYSQGTSMAAPHVAGVASLVLGQNPGMTPGELLTHLQVTARPFPSGSTCNTSICGSGIVDAYNALSTAPLGINVFLPAVMNNYPKALSNPGFESGPTGWTEYSANGWDIIVNTPPVTPHGGSWLAWLGGGNYETSYVQQYVTVSSATPYLAYWHWSASEDDCGYDYELVVINESQIVNQFDLCISTNTGGWVKRVVNLSAYKGQTVSLQIRVETDSTLSSAVLVDDVSFQASAAGVLSPASSGDLNQAPVDSSLMFNRP